MQHNSVPTTCTASLITGWHGYSVNARDEKIKCNERIRAVKHLINLGFKKDFAIIHAFTTHNQHMEDFLTHIGFKLAFHGTKKDDDEVQRHQETGDLYLWACTPKEYQEGLEEYLTELEELKDKIDPPKHPDPARQKFPELRLLDLRKGELVQPNAKVDNPIYQVLLVKPEVAERFIKMTFGMDIKKWCEQYGSGDHKADWTKITGRRLKEMHVAWKAELV